MPTIVDILKACALEGTGEFCDDKPSNATLKIGPGATIYRRKGNRDVARIRIASVPRFPDGERLRELLELRAEKDGKIDGKNNSRDYIIWPQLLESHVLPIICRTIL